MINNSLPGAVEHSIACDKIKNNWTVLPDFPHLKQHIEANAVSISNRYVFVVGGCGAARHKMLCYDMRAICGVLVQICYLANMPLGVFLVQVSLQLTQKYYASHV